MAGEVRKLVEGCGIRFFTTPMGKALLDEHHPLYGGCYAGANSLEAVRNEVEAADFALYVGALKSDFNSGSFSVGIDPKVVVELHSFTTTVGVSLLPLDNLCYEAMADKDSTPTTPRPIFDISSHSFSQHSRRLSACHRVKRSSKIWRKRSRLDTWIGYTPSPRRVVERRSNMTGFGQGWAAGSKIQVSLSPPRKHRRDKS